jgi:hypothetical protein
LLALCGWRWLSPEVGFGGAMALLGQANRRLEMPNRKAPRPKRGTSGIEVHPDTKKINLILDVKK